MLTSLESFTKRWDTEVFKAVPESQSTDPTRIFRYLDKTFYPVSGLRLMPSVDRFIAFAIMASVCIVVLELMGTDEKAIIGPKLLFAASSAFFVVFLAEFVIRTYLRRTAYLSRWGWIDFMILMAEGFVLATFAVFFFVSGDPREEFLLARALRALRLVLIIRLGRVVKLLTQRRYILRRLRLFVPLIWALFRTCVLVALIVALLWFLAVSFSPRPSSEVTAGIWEAIKSILNLQNLLSEQTDTITASVTLLAAFVIASIALNVFGFLFVPIFEREKAKRQLLERDLLLFEHVVICVNDFQQFGGTLEEFVRVFRKYADRDVVILMGEDDSSEIEELANKHLTFHKGDVMSVGLWAKAAPERASAIILLGTSDLEPEDYAVHLRAPEQTRITTTPVFSVSETHTEYSREQARNDSLVEIIKIPSERLMDDFVSHAWDMNSRQYSVFKRLVSEYDASVGLPEPVETTSEVPAEVRGFFDAHSGDGVETTIKDGAILLRADSENASEQAEVHMIALVEQAIQARLAGFENTAVFIYVDTLDLLKWNDIFSEYRFGYVTVIATELSLPLAILHEHTLKEAMNLWLLQGHETSEHLLGNDWPRKQYSLSALDTALKGQLPGRLIGAVRRPDGRHMIYTDRTSSRIEVRPGDIVLYAS